MKSQFEDFCSSQKGKILFLPARAFGEKIIMEYPKVNKWGFQLKVILRKIAKQFSEYYFSVQISPSVAGRSDDGQEIPINTLGRWIFGVPGYQGNVIFEGGETEKIRIRIPKNFPEEGKRLLEKAVEKS